MRSCLKPPFLGSWKLTRTVQGVDALIAKVKGKASITKASDLGQGAYLYEESGEMSFEGKSSTVSVSKSYYLTIKTEGKEEATTEDSSSGSSKDCKALASETMTPLLPLDVHFSRDEKGIPISALSSESLYVTFNEIAKEGFITSTLHHCGDDLYNARLHLLDQSFKTECIVKGPKKDFTIFTEYEYAD
mmetsp:Transcript_4697/g.6655  ORF Transcript_4697/g.6655 Transcript_4697/m.6655 type:complete len:189 (+) Transcript_4697:156-722(+)|eukprot:CAMPEP_0184486274 /NCGR_PEP_ID=MMETSP0113_2-20130426/7787_1 /TAXON_ID=91329 /ORGANISM="Norrisiella sphaerica, Strain BC52" /LENGTH=188 /DNA_ID=CAMNT_0026868063 /DNA_START=151 /DNA_END=717 /DNA_ORIENTATION=-